MAGMSNEEITNEFETLFGTESEEEISEEESEETTEETEEETEEEETEESEEEESEEEESEEETEDDKKEQSRQNYAFAQQRRQIKEQENFIKNLGKLIGMEGAKQEDIQKKIQEVLLEKQSKEQNIPVEILQRLERAEAIVQENQTIKLQNEVQNSFADLAEKHQLGPKEIKEFTDYLIDNDKNPLDHPEVDIAAEYLKLHWEDMLQAAVENAVKKETDRKKKVDEKSPTSTPDGKGAPEESKVNTVDDLDKLFGSMDL